MPKINEQVLREVGEMLSAHLFDYRNALEEAYCRLDDPLTVNLAAKFSEGKEGIKVDTAINFVSDRVKDKSSREINGRQKSLFVNKGAAVDPERARIREILFRNFDDLRRQLERSDMRRRRRDRMNDPNWRDFTAMEWLPEAA